MIGIFLNRPKNLSTICCRLLRNRKFKYGKGPQRDNGASAIFIDYIEKSGNMIKSENICDMEEKNGKEVVGIYPNRYAPSIGDWVR